MASLTQVHFSVPASPRVEGEGHSTLAAHVTEGTLSGSVSTRTADTGNSGNSSTCSPGFGGVLHAGEWVDSVGLLSVLGEGVVNVLHDVVADGSQEDGWQAGFAENLVLFLVAEYGDCGSEHLAIYKNGTLFIKALVLMGIKIKSI